MFTWLFISIGLLTKDGMIIIKDFERDAVKESTNSKPSFDDKLNGAVLHKTLKRLKAPMFKDHLATNKKYTKAVSVDLNSHPSGKEYKTVIEDGFKSGQIFAKNYRIAHCGFGSGVGLVWIINAETGKIVDQINVGDGISNSFYCLPDSILFIDSSHLLYEETDRHVSVAKFYIFNEKTEKLELIKEIPQGEIAKLYPLNFESFSFEERFKYNVDPKKYSCNQVVTIDASKMTTQEDPYTKITECKSRDARHLL